MFVFSIKISISLFESVCDFFILSVCKYKGEQSKKEKRKVKQCLHYNSIVRVLRTAETYKSAYCKSAIPPFPNKSSWRNGLHIFKK